MSELDKIEFEKLAEIASQLSAALNRGQASTEIASQLSTATDRIQTLQQEGLFDSELSEKRKSRLSQEQFSAVIRASISPVTI